MLFNGFNWTWSESEERSFKLANADVRKTKTEFFEPGGPPVIHGFEAVESFADGSSDDFPLEKRTSEKW